MKYSNLDEQLNEGFSALRKETTPIEATDRAVRAMTRPHRAHPASTWGLKLAGLAGTAAVLGLAFWPRAGSGIAWAQVVSQMDKASRIHETLALRHKDGTWTDVIDRWSDGIRYSMHYGTPDNLSFEARFDGVKSYSCQAPLGYCVIQTIPEKDRKEAGSLGLLGNGYHLIEDFIKDEKGKVESQEKVQDEKLGEVLRYKIRTSMMRMGKWVFVTQLVYVEPETKRIRKWELLGANGTPEQRGRIDYPETIDESQFQIPAKPPFPVHDLDVERKEVAATIRKGIGVVHAGGAKATLRAVLAENNRYVWVFWSGDPPNGDLQHPVLVEGFPKLKGYGVPILTSSRARMTGSYPSLLGPEPLSGMCVYLGDKTPATIDLRIPVFKKDLKQPILDASHKVVGYRSRFLGYDTVKDVHPIQVPSVYAFGDLVGLRKAQKGAGKAVVVGFGIVARKAN